MKNWKKWLAAGCMAALLGIGTMGTTAMAMGGGGVDRSEAVAEEEKVPRPPHCTGRMRRRFCISSMCAASPKTEAPV